MAEPQNPVAPEGEGAQENPIAVFVLNLLATFKKAFPFPSIQKKGNDFKRTEAADASSSQQEPIIADADSIVVDGGDVREEIESRNLHNQVSFPKRTEGFASVELEAKDAERSTNPLILWQVYAVGGFLIGRWAWAKWNQRQAQKKPDEKKSDDDDEPPNQ